MARTLCNKETSFLSCRYRYLIFLLLLSFCFKGCKNDQPEIRLLFTGDILLSRNVRNEIEERKLSPWNKLNHLFREADMVFGNLEGAVGELKDSLPSDHNSPVFAIQEQHLSLLAEAGFNILSVENNHSNDLGETGRKNTVSGLLKEKIDPVSFGGSPSFYKIQNVTIAMIAINLVPGRNEVHEVPSIEIKQKLRLAKSLADLTVVSVHWGSELLSWPNTFQRNTAAWLVKNGADLIIGSHPHVIQKPELIEGKPVFFSLGNHLFDQKYPETKKGLIADCRIKNGKFNCKGILTECSNKSFFPEIKGDAEFSFVDIPLNKPLEHAGFTIGQETLNDPGKRRLALQGFVNGKRVWESHPINMVSLFSSRLDGENEYLILLEKHYSRIDGEIAIRPYVYSVSDIGLTARWRGSALAWPLLDADILPGNEQILCALHRGDSFMQLDPGNGRKHTGAYRWNGFGFKGENDPELCRQCKDYYKEVLDG